MNTTTNTKLAFNGVLLDVDYPNDADTEAVCWVDTKGHIHVLIAHDTFDYESEDYNIAGSFLFRREWRYAPYDILNPAEFADREEAKAAISTRKTRLLDCVVHGSKHFYPAGGPSDWDRSREVGVWIAPEVCKIMSTEAVDDLFAEDLRRLNCETWYDLMYYELDQEGHPVRTKEYIGKWPHIGTDLYDELARELYDIVLPSDFTEEQFVAFVMDNKVTCI